MTRAPLPSYFRFILLLIGLNSAFQFFQGFAVPILLEGGVSAQGAALVLSLGYFLGSLFQIYVGRILDEGRYRRAEFAVMATLLAGAVCMLLPGAYSWARPLAVILIIISTTSLATLIWLCMESRLPPEQQARASSAVYLAINVGGSIGAVLAYFFWRTHLTLLLILDIITALVLLFGMSRVLGPAAQGAAAHSTLPKGLNEYRRLVPPLPVLLVVINLMSYFSSMSIVFSELGLDAAKATAIMNGVGTLTVSVVGLTYYRVADRFSHASKLFVGSVFLTVGWAGFAWIGREWDVAFWVFLWAIGEVIFVPEISVIIYRRFGGAQAGRAAAAKTIAYRLGLMLAPLLGALIPHVGVRPFCWFIAAMAMVAWALFYRESRHSVAN